MKSLLEQEGRDDLSLRISVQPGGCSGLRYQLFFDERSLDGDVMTDFDGVGVGRPDERALPQRRDDRLRRQDREAGVHDRQPQRDRLLRVWRLFPLSPGQPEHTEAPANGGGFRFSGAGSVQVQVERVRDPLCRLADLDLALGQVLGKSVVEVGGGRPAASERQRCAAAAASTRIVCGLSRSSYAVTRSTLVTTDWYSYDYLTVVFARARRLT